MPSPIHPSHSSFPLPAQHADDPDGPSPHGLGSTGDGHQPNDVPGHDDGGGRTDNDVAEGRGQLNGDGDGSLAGDTSGRGIVARGDGNGAPGMGEGSQTTTPGQPGPGLPAGRTGGAGSNVYGNNSGSNVYGNGGVNAGAGPYAGGVQTPGLGGIFGQVSQAASSIFSGVFGSAASSQPNSLPNLFTEQLPHFVGDTASRAQPTSEQHAPAPGNAPMQRAANDAPALAPRNANANAQIAPNAGPGVPEGEGRGLLPTPAQAGIDARAAQLLAQGGAPLAAMQTAAESAAQWSGASPATSMEADALARALLENQNKTAPARTDGKDATAQLRQGALPEGETGLTQQTAPSKSPSDTLDRLMTKLPADARPTPDARIADGRLLDPRVADARLALPDAAARSTLEGNASRQAGDIAKAASAAEGRIPLGADGKANTTSFFGRGLFGGTVEYTRQALDWVGQQVREFSVGNSPDADGARAMRVVAGLVVASVAVLVVIGVLYALRIIFVA